MCFAVSACASQVQNKEDLLAAAGFTVVPANTPERQASLRTMPQHQFVQQVRNNQVVFAYADPTVCDCLYIGNQAAYDRFRHEMYVRNIVNEQQATAQFYNMEMGPWGPGWWY
jgi:phosphate starvation-inducible protein PhoH